MRAFVLSGGGNYGALQAGALASLIQHGLRPDLIIGASAGALNAAWFAAHPTPSGVRELCRLWIDQAPRAFPPLASVNTVMRLARGKDGILSNSPLVDYIRRFGPGDGHFRDYRQPRLYVVAVRLSDGILKVFGDDPDERVLDGLMASTAVPPVFRPWEVDGVAYVDGGVISNLPLEAAVARGADEVYALLIGPHSLASLDGKQAEGALGVTGQAVSLMLNHQVSREIEEIRRRRGVRLHVIRLDATPDPGFWNFEAAGELIAAGRQSVDHYLDPRPTRPSYRERWQALQRRWSEQPGAGAVPLSQALNEGPIRSILR